MTFFVGLFIVGLLIFLYVKRVYRGQPQRKQKIEQKVYGTVSSSENRRDTVTRRPQKTRLSINESTGRPPVEFVVFDLETTGLDASKHEIIEIGAVKVNKHSNHHTTFQTLVKPKKKVPKRITEITGITQAMVESGGIAIEDALPQLIDFIGDLPLVAYNISFDMGFLQASLLKVGMNSHNAPDTICALKMARKAWPGRQSYKLKDLAIDGNLDVSDSHRALGDCQRTIIVYLSAVSALARIR